MIESIKLLAQAALILAVCLARQVSAQSLLQITSPAEGATFVEGQVYTITIAADPAVQNIYVITQHPLPAVQSTPDPLQFTLALPISIAPGLYQITAVGSTANEYIESVPVHVDVERQAAPKYLVARPASLALSGNGDALPIDVEGIYATGGSLSLKRSLLTSYTSANPLIATVDGYGLITAVGPGQTSIVVHYGSLSTTVDVVVSPAPPVGTPPVISDVSPSLGTPSVTQVTVTGSNFGATQGNGFVQLGTLSATTVTSWNDTEIIATVPLGSMSGVAIVNQNGLYSNQVPFTATAPSIMNLSPVNGNVGTSVTITGSSFGLAQGYSTISFNGVEAAPSSWSDGSIGVPVPPGASSGNVVVTASGLASNGVFFTVIPPPSITNTSPNSGAVGVPLTVLGTNFGNSQAASTVKFNGTTATATAWSDTSISTTVPVGATTGNVVVTVNGSASNGVLFTVLPTPNIISLSPTSGAIGALVTITGTNFGSTRGSSTASFNGAAATSYTSWNATTIKATVPAGATTGNVVVTVNGVSSNGVLFTITPHISSLSPTSGAAGILVTVTGTNFGPSQGASTVKFNGTAATSYTSWSDTVVKANVPPGATTGNATVTVNGAVSNGVSFTVLPTPNISSLSPTSGAVGATVNINGTNFGSSRGTSTVNFHGTAVTSYTSWSATLIKVKVPSGATTGDVIVTVNNVASNGKSFTVN